MSRRCFEQHSQASGSCPSSFDVEQAKLAVDAARHSLGADRHQYFAAMHHDVETDRYHVHLAINKISLDGRVLDRWQDYAKLGRQRSGVNAR